MFVASAVALTMSVACKKKKTDTPADAFTVENKQNTFLVYNTATWCGPCGVYGGPTFKGVLDNPDIVAINLHTSNSSWLTPIYSPGGAKKDTAMVALFAPRLYAQTKPNGYIPHSSHFKLIIAYTYLFTRRSKKRYRHGSSFRSTPVCSD